MEDRSPVGVRLTLLLAAALPVLAGCPPAVVMMQQAEPTPKGALRYQVSAGALTLQEVSTDGEPASDEVAIVPDLELAMRFGAGKHVDVGGRVTLLGLLNFDVYLRLLDTEHVDLAVMPGVGTWIPVLLSPGSWDNGTPSVLHGYLPLMIAIQLGKHALMVVPRAMAWMVSIRDSSMVVPLLGGVLGADLDVGGVHLLPEIGASCQPASTPVCFLHAAFGLSFTQELSARRSSKP